ncbi:MAG: MFS transporter [Candidatus Hodarchaeales archaeon]|jgi:MFS family permease
MKADIFNLTKITYVLVFGASISNLAAGLLEPTVAPYLEILGSSSQEIGTIVSGRFLLIALFSLPLALFASRFGLKRFLYLAGLGILVGGIMISFGGKNGVYWFYISIGFVSAIFSGPGTALIAENKGSKRITAFSLFFATWMIPTAGGALISAIWFWGVTEYTPENLSSIFPLTMFIMILGAFFFVLLLLITNREKSRNNEITYEWGPNNQEETSKARETTVPIRKQFQLLFAPIVALPLSLLMFSELLSGAGAGSSLPYLTPYLKSLNATPGELSILVFIMNIFMGVATQFPPILSKWFGDLRVYAVTMSLSVICLIGIIFSDDLLISAIFFIFRGTFANMNAPIAQSRVFTFIDERVRATGIATFSTIRWVGWSVFSPISGRIIDDYGYNIAFTFTSVIYMVALVLFIRVIQRFKSLEAIKSGSHSTREPVI